MSEISGEIGAVYYNAEITDTAVTGSLVFTTGKTIYSCGAGAMNFVTEGYTSGMLVTLTGCTTTTGNNRIFTLTAVTSGQLTVSETMLSSTPEAGAVVFTEAEPGIEALGFFNWTLSYAGDVLETTNFDNSTGGRSYIPGITSWTATAEKHFLTSNNAITTGKMWVGETCEIRLFLNYLSSTSTPSTGNPSLYWKGDTVVTGIDETTPVDALINQSISFQGDGTLTLKTQTDLWSSGIST